MTKIRFKYSKTGPAKYISNLDLMAVMQRAFLRAGIGLKYSEGFNPHPYISVALPLPVGNESICEMMDVGLKDEALPDINAVKLPEGLFITEVYKPSRKFNEITWVEISCTLQYDDKTGSDIIIKLKDCFDKDCIYISKKTKRGHKELDIASFIKNIGFELSESKSMVLLTAVVPAQNPTINGTDILSVLGDDLSPVHAGIKRIGIFDPDMILFT